MAAHRQSRGPFCRHFLIITFPFLAQNGAARKAPIKSCNGRPSSSLESVRESAVVASYGRNPSWQLNEGRASNQTSAWNERLLRSRRRFSNSAADHQILLIIRQSGLYLHLAAAGCCCRLSQTPSKPGMKGEPIRECSDRYLGIQTISAAPVRWAGLFVWRFVAATLEHHYLSATDYCLSSAMVAEQETAATSRSC